MKQMDLRTAQLMGRLANIQEFEDFKKYLENSLDELHDIGDELDDTNKMLRNQGECRAVKTILANIRNADDIAKGIEKRVSRNGSGNTGMI